MFDHKEVILTSLNAIVGGKYWKAINRSGVKTRSL